MAKTLLTLIVALIATSFHVPEVLTIPLPCNEIVRLVTPCMPYLSGRAVMPFRFCCGGITILNQTAVSRTDKMTLCNCLKGVSTRFPIVDFSRAALLPRLCGITVNVTVTPNMDCSSVPQF